MAGKSGLPSRRDYTDQEIRSFVADLESLPGGELTVSLLVGCGERAIVPLREFLLQGRPRGIFQPRQRAVEALGQLGAKDILMEYLSQRRQIEDAVVRFGEEAVENTAARELTRWLTEDVYQFVLHLAEQRMLVGLIETLGEFERPAAAPALVRALGDDICRPAAESALLRIAVSVKPFLVHTALASTAGDEEKARERQRRRSVVRVLAETNLSPEEWSNLRPLLQDHDEEVAILAAEIAVDSAPVKEKEEAARFLITSLAGSGGFLQIRIAECLQRNYSVVRDVIDSENKTRRQIVKGEPLADQVVRILTSIQSSGEKPGSKEKGSHGQRENTADRK